MPNLQAQFKGESNLMGRRLNDLDHANIVLSSGVERLVLDNRVPDWIRRSLEQTLKAAYEIVGPR